MHTANEGESTSVAYKLPETNEADTDWFENDSACSIEIDVNKIPDHVRGALVSPLMAIIADYYKKSGNEEKYQAWLIGRRTRMNSKQL